MQTLQTNYTERWRDSHGAGRMCVALHIPEDQAMLRVKCAEPIWHPGVHRSVTGIEWEN